MKPKKELGATIDRYGKRDAMFTSPEGTPIELRSLPEGSEALRYTKFEVLKPLPVESGTTASWFGQPGGGAQYRFKRDVNDLIRDGLIRVVE